MTDSERDLVAEEGVDEGSAKMSSEGDAGPDVDGVGPSAAGGPVNDEQDAAPDLVETPESRQAQHGQQLQAGEG
ncbi:MAG: hypothetical protein JWN77_2350 [Frankiales bacterium]|jgi:hypothetical protein|nr:hypothetical protein [Frankiales bacterium]